MFDSVSIAPFNMFASELIAPFCKLDNGLIAPFCTFSLRKNIKCALEN